MAQVQNYSVGQTVNDFTVTDTEGNVHNLYTITASGKHVMLDFFFDTCPPCQQTQPFYNQLHEVYGCNGHDLFVISINNGTDNNAAVTAFEATYGGPYAHSPAVGIEGGCAAVDAAFGITAYPTYCLIGPDNKLKNGDIWPVSNMQSFVNAFPVGSSIQPAQCAVVGMNEHKVSAVKNVFPVPAHGPVTLEVALATAGAVAIEVIDATGRTAHSEMLGMRAAGSFVHTMDLGRLSEGNYMMRLSLDGASVGTYRLVMMR
jgi:thiol-disulfide isomerase/thioredoxin